LSDRIVLVPDDDEDALTQALEERDESDKEESGESELAETIVWKAAQGPIRILL
jgi:hypothetical protein